MCKAVHYLHSRGITHRDLKLENFLFEDEEKQNVKLIDFGLSKENKGQKMKEIVGTPYYVSPEIMQDGINSCYTEICDEWSLGVCLYKMITGHYPFEGDEIEVIIEKIRSGKYNEEALLPFSFDLRNLIKGLLTVNTFERLRIQDVLQ
jgi:serine/threonine protein kinase